MFVGQGRFGPGSAPLMAGPVHVASPPPRTAPTPVAPAAQSSLSSSTPSSEPGGTGDGLARHRPRGLRHFGGRPTVRAAPPDPARATNAKVWSHPGRSAGGTRLYSGRERRELRQIAALTDTGINIAGIKRVFELQDEVRRLESPNPTHGRQNQKTNSLTDLSSGALSMTSQWADPRRSSTWSPSTSPRAPAAPGTSTTAAETYAPAPGLALR